MRTHVKVRRIIEANLCCSEFARGHIKPVQLRACQHKSRIRALNIEMQTDGDWAELDNSATC